MRTSGGRGRRRSAASGLFGGDNGIFAGLLGGRGSSATGAINVLGTSTGASSGAIYAAIGNPYIERDGQHVIAHRGEAILTARENELYRASVGRGSQSYGGGASGGGPVTVTNVFHITESRNARDTAAQVGSVVEQTMSRLSKQQGGFDAISPGGRQR